MKAALVYAQKLGWRVVPLHSIRNGKCTCSKGKDCTRSAGKHPRILHWEIEASSDPGVIQGWADQWPDANIGLATGHTFFVLDVDPDNGGDDTLDDLLDEHGPLPETPEARTGSGGTHYLFKMPAFEVSNSAGKLGAGLDVRGTGGQIVAAPSKTLKGGYSWVRAPWDVPLAEAPEWLLELVQARRSAGPAAATTDRGYFPPASEEVLEAARGVLEGHGPAIEGQGGDEHTMHAAALLTHDFALSDEEAWPLLLEWNDTCQPPWEEEDLRTKLRNGLKYGKLAYGCRRSIDSLEAGRKLVKDWQISGTGEKGMFAMLDRVRSLTFHDEAKMSMLVREAHSATGIPKREIGLKLSPIIERPAGSIEVTTRLHEVADLSRKAIASKVFMRNGTLVEVAKNADRTFISELEPARIIDLMSECSKYFRVDEKAGIVNQSPPPTAAAILHARRMHPGVRVLEAITTAPVFLADGSILQERGYNSEARVFLEPSVTVDVPDEPARDDARKAVRVFRDLLCNFKFASKADFSSWLAALLSPLVKAATGNAPSPLICISASNAGAGKTLLTKAISQIITGGDAEIRPYNPKDPAEWGKRLTAFVKAGSPVSVFDNVNGPVGDEGLDRLITSSVWSDRQLGASEAPPLPNVSTWMATGNNIEPIGDTVRRVLMVRIEVDTERPQERSGFKYDLDGGYALEHRSELLSAALTILRAFHVAGRPAQEIPSWGSFPTWSGLVRGALVWTGLADPFETQRRASAELNEPDNDAHDFWLSVVEESGDGTASEIVAIANSRDAVTVLGLRSEITTLYLKRFLGRFIDKPRGERRIRKEGARYKIEAISR